MIQGVGIGVISLYSKYMWMISRSTLSNTFLFTHDNMICYTSLEYINFYFYSLSPSQLFCVVSSIYWLHLNVIMHCKFSLMRATCIVMFYCSRTLVQCIEGLPGSDRETFDRRNDLLALLVSLLTAAPMVPLRRHCYDVATLLRETCFPVYKFT